MVNMVNPITNPFTPLLTSFLLIAWAAGFTAPNSYYRVWIFVPVLSTIWLTYSVLQNHPLEHPFYSSFLGGSSCSVVLKYVDVVLLNKWGYAARGPTSALGGMDIIVQTKDKDTRHRGRGTFSRRMRFGLAQSFNERYTSTPWQIKNVPPFDSKHPEYVTNRRYFLLESATTVVIYVALLEFLGFLASDTSKNEVNFAPERVAFFSRLHDISIQDLVVRIISTLIWWTAANWILQVMYYSLAFGAVFFNITTAAS